jgi:RecJ-like exonuclease
MLLITSRFILLSKHLTRIKLRLVKGYGDNITCDNCWDSVDEWWSADHAICNKCHTKYQQELTPEKTINDIKREQEESNE